MALPASSNALVSSSETEYSVFNLLKARRQASGPSKVKANTVIELPPYQARPIRSTKQPMQTTSSTRHPAHRHVKPERSPLRVIDNCFSQDSAPGDTVESADECPGWLQTLAFSLLLILPYLFIPNA